MGIFSSNKDKSELVLVFDIGSSTVGGALFWTDKIGVPKIVFSVREQIPLEEDIEADKFFSSTIKTLSIVSKKVHEAGIGAPKEIFCVLSSPWHVSQTRVIRFEKDEPFLFTSKFALNLIQKEISIFEAEYLSKYPGAKTSVRSIEYKTIKTMLNGYETSKPLDQKTKELQMTIFISIGEEGILKKIEETVRESFHFKQIKFSSFLLASFAVVRDLYSHQDSFLLVDVGGEVTDISMMKKNMLRESISFPSGYNFMIRGLAKETHSTYDEAKSSISLLKDGHAAPEAMKTSGSILEKLKTEWLSSFQTSLSRLTNDIYVPSTIYLVVDESMAEFFSGIIKNEQFNQYTLAESKFEVVFLGAGIFHGLATFEEDVIRDPKVIIDAIYFNRFLNRI